VKAWLLVLTLSLAGSGCDRTRADGAEASAQFGIFFGGQIQQRQEIPFELDTTRQTQGFRVELDAPSDRDRTIAWEVARPSGSARGPRRVTVVGSATLGRGQRILEQTLPFEPGDPLGLWNVRVVLDDRVLLDRPFLVYDRASRTRTRPDAGTPIP
jgi:hypothetical protein